MKRFIHLRKNDKKQSPIMIALDEIIRIEPYENPTHDFPVEVAHAVITLKTGSPVIVNETYNSLLSRMDNCMAVII